MLFICRHFAIVSLFVHIIFKSFIYLRVLTYETFLLKRKTFSEFDNKFGKKCVKLGRNTIKKDTSYLAKDSFEFRVRLFVEAEI